MPYVMSPFSGKLDYYETNVFRGVLADAPSDPEQGWWYVNSGDNGYYVYYGVSWQLLATLIPAANVDLTNEDLSTLTNEDGTTLQREP
jgi:hypothetical protein